MTTGNKLARLRKNSGLTQEQLAEMLNVSRQSISKWESDTAYPETEKLIKLGEIFNCSMDYLLKEGAEETDTSETPQKTGATALITRFHFEYKSEKTIGGLPLCHINIGLGHSAKGFIAIGLAARGIISLGIFSLGIISLGAFSLGILALGAFSLGAFAFGAICAGLIAMGAIALGVIAVGAVSVGGFSVGAVAVGKYLAIGDRAFGDIALGKTQMNAHRFGIAPFNSTHFDIASDHLDESVPWYFSWAKRIIQAFL